MSAADPDSLDAAFLEWWCKDRNERREDEPLLDRYERAFQAGVEFMAKAAAEAAGADRKGSDLRGRVVVFHRPLWPNEVERENPGLVDTTHWPCLQLDDGTLVYPVKTGPDGSTVPAKFFGYKPHLPEGERKVSFNVSVLGRF